MKRVLFALGCALIAATPAAAQTFDHLRIGIRGQRIANDGGERPAVFAYGRTPGVVVIGQDVSASITITKSGNGCFLSIAGPGSLDGEFVWTVNATPTKVVNDAVTFRLHWRRTKAGGLSPVEAADAELTLRPGESVPIDLLEVPPAPGCSMAKVSVRVGVEYAPDSEYDRRVVAADVWLTQKPGGADPTEPVALRGQFHQPMPFYFTTIADKGVSLDFYGTVTIHPRDGFDEVKIKTYSRLIEGGQEIQTMSANMPGRPGMFRAREVESTIQLKPGEVVSVELPRLGENSSGAFADRTFSLTLRARRLR